MLENGSLIAKLTLDDPAQCSRVEHYQVSSVSVWNRAPEVELRSIFLVKPQSALLNSVILTTYLCILLGSWVRFPEIYFWRKTAIGFAPKLFESQTNSRKFTGWLLPKRREIFQRIYRNSYQGIFDIFTWSKVAFGWNQRGFSIHPRKNSAQVCKFEVFWKGHKIWKKS